MQWVTMLYDVGRHEANTQRKQLDTYFPLGQKLLSTKIKLSIYCEDEVRAKLQQLPEFDPLIHNCVVLPFEELPFFDISTAMVAAREKKPWIGGNNFKDTPIYCSMVYAKLELLRRMATDPTGTYGWVDFGLAGVDDVGLLPTIQHTVGDYIRALCVTPTTAAEIQKPEVLFGSGHLAKVAAGILTGTGKAIADFATVFNTTARKLVADGYTPLEQEIWGSILNYKVPAKLYYGDYIHIVRNYNVAIGAHTYILATMRRMMDIKEHKIAIEISQYILSTEVPDVVRAETLEIVYISHYYTYVPAARDIALLIIELYTKSEAAREYYHSKWDSLCSNLNYIAKPSEVVVMNDIQLAERLAAKYTVRVITTNTKSVRGLAGSNPYYVTSFRGTAELLVSDHDISEIRATRISPKLAAKYL